MPLTQKLVYVRHFAKLCGLSGLWYTCWGLHQVRAKARADFCALEVERIAQKSLGTLSPACPQSSVFVKYVPLMPRLFSSRRPRSSEKPGEVSMNCPGMLIYLQFSRCSETKGLKNPGNGAETPVATAWCPGALSQHWPGIKTAVRFFK